MSTSPRAPGSAVPQPAHQPDDGVFAHQIFSTRAAEVPEATALISSAHHMSYRELDRRSNQLAHELRSRGVGPEVPVGLCLDRCFELVIGLLGILKSGGVCVPLDPQQPDKVLRALSADLDLRLVLSQSTFDRDLSVLGAERLEVDRMAFGDQPIEPVNDELRSGNLAFVFLTSGSAGRPKAVMWGHARGSARERSWAQKKHGLDASDCHLLKCPIGFTLLVREIFWPLCTGGRLVIAPPSIEHDSTALVELIRSQAVTVVNLVPTLLRSLVQEPGFRQCSALREVICFGEPLSRDLQRRLLDTLDVNLSVYYGTTEAPTATYGSLSASAGDTTIEIGRRCPGRQIYVLDHNLQPCPTGAAGEIFIGGPLARGYLAQPALTADRFLPNPFSSEPGERLYRSGDLGRFRSHGGLEFLGRNDNQVQVRGVRVELETIDAALASHPAVEHAAATLHRSEHGDSLTGHLTLVDPADQPTAESIRSFLRRQLPDYMVPSRLLHHRAMPLTTTGKIDRRALAEVTGAVPLGGGGGGAPRTDTEKALAAIWAEVLEAPEVGLNDSFFEQGGHSLNIVRLFAEIKRRLGVQLPLTTIFEAPTLVELAERIDGGGSRAPAIVVPLQRAGPRPPFFAVHAHEGDVLFYQDLARRLGPAQPFFGIQSVAGEPRSDIVEMAARYVREVQRVQPEGPYFLGGYCFGGTIAFEMACRMRAQGDDVALLAIIDVGAPAGNGRAAPVRLRHRAVNLFRRARSEAAGLPLLSGRDRIAYLRRRLGQARQRLQWKIEGRTDRNLERARQALRDYRPGVYPGHILLFKAQVQPSGAGGDPEMGWGRLAASGVSVYEIPGYHQTIQYEPRVGGLAAALDECLQRAAVERSDRR